MEQGSAEATIHYLRIKAGNLHGELYQPRDGAGIHPAIVIMNSSAGVCDTRERFYARFLAEHGFAALVVDSFQVRGIPETTTDQSRIRDQEMEQDAYEAFGFLASDPRIDARRIGIMGVSRGGLAALNTALLARRRWFGRPDQDFAARVAIVPPAHLQQRDARTDGKPLLFLLAGRDDYTGVEAARDYAARIASAGNTGTRVLVYPEAHHAWERTGPAIFLAEAENYSRCRMWIEDDATLTERPAGRNMTMEAFFAGRDRYRVLGGHAGGGTEAFKLRAAEGVLDFFASKTSGPTHP